MEVGQPRKAARVFSHAQTVKLIVRDERGHRHGEIYEPGDSLLNGPKHAEREAQRVVEVESPVRRGIRETDRAELRRSETGGSRPADAPCSQRRS